MSCFVGDIFFSRRTQICPGTVLSRDLEVLEWPRGLSLSPGTELVKLNHGCDMPIGYHPTQFPRTELFAMGLEKNSFVVRLPHFIKMESAQQVTEGILSVSNSLIYRNFMYCSCQRRLQL